MVIATTINLSSLDGNNGFRLDGEAQDDNSGSSVSNAGDVNGDGFDDLIIGAPGNRYDELIAGYVVFGKASGFDATQNLSTLDGSNGFRLDAVVAANSTSLVVSNAGDVNGDGFDDVLVGTSGYTPYVGGFSASYVVFGKPSGFDATLDLDSLDGSNGFSLGEGPRISNAGDVNGDGFADVILGAPYADPNGNFSSSSYVVFGRASGFDAAMNLSSLDGNNGFRLDGVAADDRSGSSVSSAGDVNGDGFDDVIVAASGADSNGERSGSSFIVFGKASGFDATMNLSSLDGSNGFRLDGAAAAYNFMNRLVSSAGDVNGDGFDDVIIGAPYDDPNGDGSGSSYVVFGKASGFAAALDLSSLDGNNGFRLDGAKYSLSGSSVSNAGDVNGDGFDDLIIGVRASPNGDFSGSSYVVFGRAAGFDAALDLSNIDSTSGLRLDGVTNDDRSGSSVSGAGDVNGDGFDDLIVGAPNADSQGEYSDSGSSYVLFGSSQFDGTVTYVGTPEDDILTGTPADERFEGGDGSDTLIGGGGADVFDGGGDDDVIRVADLDFQALFGGVGTDTLELTGSGIDMNLANFHDEIDGIETIDLTGSGDNTLTFTLPDLFTLSDRFSSPNATQIFTVDGDAGDRVVGIGPGWADGGIEGNYHIYTNRGTAVRIDVAVSADSPPPGVISLSSLNGSNGFRLDGAAVDDHSGESVSNAGDVNGDGFDDVIVGASYADPSGDYSGSSYVVFGKPAGFDAAMNLSNLDGSNGFRLDGEIESDKLGNSVSSAGDVNGDGFDDVIVGAYFAYSNGGRSGSSYVVFGKSAGFDATLDLSSLNGTNGFRLAGAANGFFGSSVSSAGDVNGDGFDDVIIGAPLDDRNGDGSGSSYVVFGKTSGFAAALDLSSLDGNNGFRLDGAKYNLSGSSVSNAEDVNGDGFDDLIVGASLADPNGNFSSSSYVVFGKASGFDAAMNLSSLDGSNGFRVDGLATYNYSGRSVSNAGDVNGDGFDDLIIGSSGASYVVFGKASEFDATMSLSSLDGNNGFRLDGAAGDFTGFSISDAGDFNGDGFDDLIVGSLGHGRFSDSPYSGVSYVVYGKASGFSAEMDLSSLDGSNGFRLDGAAPHDETGASVSSAGDVNGDGFDDLIVGAPNASPQGEYSSGSSYVIFGRSSSSEKVIQGTPGNDKLTGTPLAERFEAGDGNDRMIGRGGEDVFHGDAGDDYIQIADLALVRLTAVAATTPCTRTARI